MKNPSNLVTWVFLGFVFFHREVLCILLFLQRGWNLKTDNFFHFVHEEKTEDETIPSTSLAQQAIEYARELEMIV